MWFLRAIAGGCWIIGHDLELDEDTDYYECRECGFRRRRWVL